MNIKADFKEDFIDLIFTEIDKLKKMDFHFDTFPEWEPKRIEKLKEIIELEKKAGEDYNYESDSLDKEKLSRNYRDDMVHQYFNLKHKIPAQQRRKIFKCANFSCPKELEDGLSILEKKIEDGEYLLPHLSRKIFDPKFSDYMFYDFGLVHFHLGTKQSAKNPLLIEGTKEILYALLNRDSCYFIRIDDHGKWDDLMLLEELKRDFPEVLELWKTSGTPIWKPTKEERKELLQFQINSPIEIGGEYYMPPGMGVNTAGTSTWAVMEMNQYFHYCKKTQNIIVTFIDKYLEKIEADNSCKLQDMDLTLKELEPIIVYDNNNKLYIEYNPITCAFHVHN